MELFGDRVAFVNTTKLTAIQYYRSIDHAVEIFSTWFGPTVSAMEKLDESEQQSLLRDMEEIFRRYNCSDDDTAIVENRYEQTVLRIN